jgi:L-alanine-DL-glutamate epimerase-like enolase superfamily enzyme
MKAHEIDQVVQSLEVEAYRIPTSEPESDGTLKWDHTDMVAVHLAAGNATGFGWTYAPAPAAGIIRDSLQKVVVGRSPSSIPALWHEMHHTLRNANPGGLCSMAISAVDVALWDLKAKLLNVPLVELFGAARQAVDIYGSGGFTSYSDSELSEQLGGWAGIGIPRVKMKVGRDAVADKHRVAVARNAIGPDTQLFVDANGGYTRKQALAMADWFAGQKDVRWFEEPRPSEDLAGLHLLRDRGPAAMDIAAGEYGDLPQYFRNMLRAQAVDCLQADATRCGGYTGFLKVADLCNAFGMPLSAHCAPQLHAHVGCAVPLLRHLEYFHDHTRIGDLLFDGMLQPKDGQLSPDRARPGHGISLKRLDAAQYRI